MTTKRPLVYVAGPYSKPDPCVNTHRAVEVAELLVVRFPLVVPVVPHLTHFWHTMRPHPYEFWTDLDLELLRRCDAVFRFEGASPGADAEVEFAETIGVPVFRTPGGLGVWLDEWLERVEW